MYRISSRRGAGAAETHPGVSGQRRTPCHAEEKEGVVDILTDVQEQALSGPAGAAGSIAEMRVIAEIAMCAFTCVVTDLLHCRIAYIACPQLRWRTDTKEVHFPVVLVH